MEVTQFVEYTYTMKHSSLTQGVSKQVEVRNVEIENEFVSYRPSCRLPCPSMQARPAINLGPLLTFPCYSIYYHKENHVPMGEEIVASTL